MTNKKFIGLILIIIGVLIFSFPFCLSFLRPKSPRISEKARKFYFDYFEIPERVEKIFFQEYSPSISTKDKKFAQDVKKAQEIVPFEILIPKKRDYFVVDLMGFRGVEKGTEKFYGVFLSKKGAFDIFVEPYLILENLESMFPEKPEEISFKGKKVYFWKFEASNLILFDTREIGGIKYLYFLGSPELPKKDLFGVLKDILK